MAIGLAEASNSHFFAISGRTDLRIGVSEAKFDLEADFDVKNSLAPPKPAENYEKPKKTGKKSKNKILSIFFSIWNRLKRVLAKFGGSKLRKNDEKRRNIANFSRFFRSFSLVFRSF